MKAKRQGIRERVPTACDRCRHKKTKCDGMSPCRRCSADLAICTYAEKKKPRHRVHNSRHVELLEQQQVQLISGLRELYSYLQTGHSWPGAPLLEQKDGYPLTHDIIERLNLARQSKMGTSDPNYIDRYEKTSSQNSAERSVHRPHSMIPVTSYGSDLLSPTAETRLPAQGGNLEESICLLQVQGVPALVEDVLLPLDASDESIWTEVIDNDWLPFDSNTTCMLADRCL